MMDKQYRKLQTILKRLGPLWTLRFNEGNNFVVDYLGDPTKAPFRKAHCGKTPLSALRKADKEEGHILRWKKKCVVQVNREEGRVV